MVRCYYDLRSRDEKVKAERRYVICLQSVMELEPKLREPDFKTDQQRADLFFLLFNISNIQES